MSEEATAVMVNLELCRELYSGEQRNQFYADYTAARCAVDAAFKELYDLGEPIGRRFWQRPPPAWKEKRDHLLKANRKARKVVEKMERQHPLLVRVYMHKFFPVES